MTSHFNFDIPCFVFGEHAAAASWLLDAETLIDSFCQIVVVERLLGDAMRLMNLARGTLHQEAFNIGRCCS